MVDPYAIVRRLTGHELISPKDACLLTEAVDNLIDEIKTGDARIAELEAENERLRKKNEYLEDRNEECEHWRIHWKTKAFEALSRTGAVKVSREEAEKLCARLEYDASWDKCGSGYYSMKRQLSALEPAARDTSPVVSHETANVEDKPAALWPVSYANSTAPGRPFEPAAPEGQQEPVAWGEFYGGKIATVRTDKSRHCTVPLYTRPSEQAVTEAEHE